jgi:energy-coupling factor transport system substrate-specific component
LSWQAGSTLLVFAALVVGFLWYERSRPSSKLVAVVGVMAAAAVAGRVVLTPIPNVQATTDVCLISGFALGAGPGFAIGAIAALASNFFLGQGPWTPWEMLGWGAAGVLGAALAMAGMRPRRWSLALVCALAGFAFGAWMDLFTLLNFTAETTGDTYLVISAASLPFNIAHAVGNALLALALGPALLRLLARFRRRFEVTWEPIAVPAATLAIVTTLALCLIAVPSALASGPRDALRYLERAQNSDGGFGGAPGQRSNQLVTGWTVIGLEAAGRNPLDVRRGGHTPIDYIRSKASPLRETGELERTIIALRGAGAGARLGGRDLVAQLLRRQRANGSFDGLVNWTSFGILALRAAGRAERAAPVRRARAYLLSQQNDDGGFTFAGRGGASDVDDTGSALQALPASGSRRSGAIRRAVSYLRHEQNDDGGFGQLAGSRSNAQSTAWAVQGLVAAGQDAGRFGPGRSPLAYLRSLQVQDGSFRYSRTSAQTPVWVTAQALAAVKLKALPPRPPARRAVRQQASPAETTRARSTRKSATGKHVRDRRATPRPSIVTLTTRPGSVAAIRAGTVGRRPQHDEGRSIAPVAVLLVALAATALLGGRAALRAWRSGRA